MVRPGTAHTWLAPGGLKTGSPGRSGVPTRSLWSTPSLLWRRGVGPPGALSLRSTVAREGTLELRGHHLSWLLSTRVVPPPAGSRLASPCCAPLQRRRGRADANPGCVGTLGRRGAAENCEFPRRRQERTADAAGLAFWWAILPESSDWLLFPPRFPLGPWTGRTISP